ncbi:unnamed protein product [Clavelina lepadiformis]|uniref:F5/8 type C domain-containing protein n=1 Tax=Clavelina lepadiformis TaxID=159417 RepID=A0ABP0FD19_CLALP
MSHSFQLCFFVVFGLLSSGVVNALFLDDLLTNIDGQSSQGKPPNTGAEIENLLFRSCLVCHGTSISAVTSSCWETVDDDDTRFVAVQSCFGACSTTVLNHTTIGLIDYTRKCEPDCSPGCYRTDQDTILCKYCCKGDRCNSVLPTHVLKGPETIARPSESNIKKWLTGSMVKPRHHARNPSNKVRARRFMDKLFLEFGIRTELQEFRVSEIVQEDEAPLNYRSYIKTVIKGYNVIATVRGRHYNTLDDEIVVLMAHYDTHPDGSNGVDDNGSGVVALLEITRLLTRDPECERNHSVIIVGTDFKEFGSFWDGLANSGYTNCIIGDNFQGMAGSAHFVCGYLLPHLRRTGSRLKAAINLQSILNYDPNPGTQLLPNFRDFITGRVSNRHFRRFENQVNMKHNVGDWILASYKQLPSDPGQASTIVDTLRQEWKDYDVSTSFKPAIIQQEIPPDDAQNIFDEDDCKPFSKLRTPLPCITLTDTGSLRGYMRRCHNKGCDNRNHLSDDRIKFVAKVVDTVWRVVEEWTSSTCPPSTKSHAITTTSTTNRPMATTLAHTAGTFFPTSPTSYPVTTQTSVHHQNRKQRVKVKRCQKPLMKSSLRNGARSVNIVATCRFSESALELCERPDDNVWALLNSKSAWIPKKDKKKHNRNLWFQVDLGERSRVTAISLQGVRKQGFIRSFMMSYSNDGRNWNWHIPAKPLRKTASEIRGNKNGKRAVKRKLKPGINARYLRIHPRKWKRRIALRMELHGCTK